MDDAAQSTESGAVRYRKSLKRIKIIAAPVVTV
jgi:hypothetical protein